MVDARMMLDLLHEWGYVIVFLAGLAEGLPFLGMLVPGQGIIILAGVLAAQGVLDLKPVLVAAVAAGILGDAVGYYIGRWRGRDLILRLAPRFRMEEKHIQSADALFHKYGPVALVFARFSFLTRGLASLLAGAHRLKQRVFWPLNIGGAIVWGVGYTLLGYLFGGSIEILEGVLGPTLAFTAGALVLLFVLYRVLKKISPGFAIEDAALVVLAGVFGVLFALLAETARAGGPTPLLDAGWRTLSIGLLDVLPQRAWQVIAVFGGAWIVTPVTLGAIAGFAWRRQWWDVFLFAAGLGGQRVITGTLKLVFARPRPEDALAVVQTFAFPSAHACSSLVLAGAIVYVLARRYRGGWQQAALIAVGVAFTLLVSLSRVALGVHYPSDVLGGWLIGAAWLCTVLVVVEAWWKTRARHVPATRAHVE